MNEPNPDQTLVRLDNTGVNYFFGSMIVVGAILLVAALCYGAFFLK